MCSHIKQKTVCFRLRWWLWKVDAERFEDYLRAADKLLILIDKVVARMDALSVLVTEVRCTLSYKISAQDWFYKTVKIDGCDGSGSEGAYCQADMMSDSGDSQGRGNNLLSRTLL